MFVDRRGFLGWCGVIGTSMAFGSERKPRIELWVNSASWGKGASLELRNGMSMGVDEAIRAAALFGGDVAVRDPRAGDEVFPPYGVWIWILDETLPSEDVQRVIETNRRRGIVFNVTDSSEALRATCERHVFHIAPRSDSARTVAAWSPALKRFGADTLNKRFQAQFGRPMTAHAWAAWFAVKCAWEAALRSKATGASDMIDYLEKPTSRFDGHKGSGLYFDTNHELVQPLYAVEGPEVREEIAPAAGQAAGVVCR